MRPTALGLVLIAAVSAMLGACGEDPDDGNQDAVTEVEVAFFMGGIASIETTECAAERERRRGTNVVTVRDHSRHYPASVVRYVDGHRADAEPLAERLEIGPITPMDPVTPTLFAGADVAVIIGTDFRC